MLLRRWWPRRGRRCRHPVRAHSLQQLVQQLLHQAVDRVGALVIRTVRRWRRLRTRCGFRGGLWSWRVGGKLTLQLVEQLAEELVGHLRTVRAARRLRSVGAESEQVAQAVQSVGTEELVEQPTQRVHAVGRVVVLGVPRPVLDLVEDLAGLVDRHREADAVAAARGARDGSVDADRTTLPSVNGPPELPELIAASVWIRSCSSPIGVGTVRPNALTMPVVTSGSGRTGCRWRWSSRPPARRRGRRGQGASDRSQRSHRP